MKYLNPLNSLIENLSISDKTNWDRLNIIFDAFLLTIGANIAIVGQFGDSPISSLVFGLVVIYGPNMFHYIEKSMSNLR